jgi:hypothetical protein
MADQIRGGAGRKDEVGRTGIYPATGPYPTHDVPIVTPDTLNRGGSTHQPSSGVDEHLKGAERQPRRGNEEDMPDSDALGG